MTQKQMDELKKLTPPVGSYVLVWGSGFFSKVVQILTYFWLGIKNAPSHVQRVYDSERDISAESSGVKLVDRIESLKSAKRVVVFCPPESMFELSPNHYKIMYDHVNYVDIANKYLNTPYDFWFYVLVAGRIFTFFIPFFAGYLIVQGLWGALLGLIAICFHLYFPFRAWLHKKSKKAWACAELSNALDCDLGISTGIHKEMSFVSSPWGIKCMCESRGDELLFDSDNFKDI
jgi:hypothetical protein